MTNDALNGRARTGGYVVATPRSTDTIGSVLRGAYGRVDQLPIDLRMALDRLDRIPG